MTKRINNPKNEIRKISKENIDLTLQQMKKDIKAQIIEFEELSKKTHISTKEQAFEDWSDVINEALAAANVPEYQIIFDFVPTKLPEEKERTFIWLGVHDAGIRTWGSNLVGEDIIDALRRAIIKNPYDLITYYDFEQIFEELYPKKKIKDPINFTILDHIADTMLNCIKNSRVDGDSSEQIIIFDITDKANVKLVCPEAI